jgi:RHS repeat-associated protein
LNTWEVLVVREHEGDWWYVTGPGLDEPILAVQRAPGTGEWLPVVSDGRGELIAIADSGGQLNSSYTGPEYDAGLWNSSGLTSHSRSFNPRRWATPGGIDTISTFRSRQYDPATGKWLQEDPIGVAGGVNLYQYNGNDPNSFGDPFGLADKCQRFVQCMKELAKSELRGFTAGLDLSRTTTRANEGQAGFILGRILGAAVPEGGVGERALAEEAGGGTRALEISFKTAHASPHLDGLSVTADDVEQAIASNIQSQAATASSTGSFWGQVTVNGVHFRFRAFTLENGEINVGTYYPITH